MVALLFPGQGSQFVGMGRELAHRFPAARDTFAEADAVLGFPLAYSLARMRGSSRRGLVVMLLFPLMTSVVVRSYGWLILLGDAGLLERNLREAMIRIARFRNILVHDYARIDPAVVVRILHEGLDDFRRFREAALGWI